MNLHQLLHLTAGYALGLTLLTAHVKPLPALLSVVAVGIGKEVIDGPREPMRKHARDAGITALGGALSVGVHFTFGGK